MDLSYVGSGFMMECGDGRGSEQTCMLDLSLSSVISSCRTIQECVTELGGDGRTAGPAFGYTRW